jgi:class 3 adenylate cyclase
VGTGTGDTAAESVRIADADRHVVIDRLREHTAAGRLTLDEFDSRVDEVMHARTVADLHATLRELPAPVPVLATQKALARRLRRHRAWVHSRNTAGINGICIAIWAMTGGGYFWPEWVLLGTGLILAGHIAGNELTDEEKKEQREREEQVKAIAATATTSAPAPNARVLASILYTDMVDSTQRVAEMGDQRWSAVLDQYEEVVRRSLERTGGVLVKALGDGALARFAAPADAIRCAVAIRDATHELGFEVRAGVHAGEIEIRGDDVTGIAVHLGQRVCSAALPGEVWVTRTVVDLVAGAGIRFDDQGEYELRGIPGPWQLYSVTP